jgi:hypothetical protein
MLVAWMTRLGGDTGSTGCWAPGSGGGRLEVKQIVRLVRAVAALLPGQARDLSFQSLSPTPRVDQPLSFWKAQGLVLFVDIFSLQQLSKQILCQKGSA